MIRIWIKSILIVLGLVILFLILTFPYARLSPRIEDVLSQGLRPLFGSSAQCSLSGFDIFLLVRPSWEKLECTASETPYGSAETILRIKNGHGLIWPGRQSLSGNIDKGSFNFTTNAGVKSIPDHLKLDLNKISLAEVSPLLGAFISRANPMMPCRLKLEGNVDGKLDLPLRNFKGKEGIADIKFANLKAPSQACLDTIGLKEMTFSKAVIKIELKGGKINFTDVSFLSDHLSGKIDGSLDLQDDLFKSTGGMNLKWKIQKSDALLSSPIGRILTQLPCPNPDSEGFCTRRISRLGELTGM